MLATSSGGSTKEIDPELRVREFLNNFKAKAPELFKALSAFVRATCASQFLLADLNQTFFQYLGNFSIKISNCLVIFIRKFGWLIDFMFQLSQEELQSLRSQNVTLEGKGKGQHSKYLPFAFTQEGVAMLSSVLRSKGAIQANIAIMRTFVKLRELMNDRRELADKINSLERQYDAQFKVVFNSIQELIKAKPKDLVEIPSSRRKIGFGRDD